MGRALSCTGAPIGTTEPMRSGAGTTYGYDGVKDKGT